MSKPDLRNARREGRRASWVSLALLLAAASCAAPSGAPSTRLSRFEFTQAQMGLPFRIVLYARDEPTAHSAAEAAFGRIKQLNDILSDYDAESELSRLSRTSGQNRTVAASGDLWRVLKKAQEMSDRSHGAFDVTVGPVVNLWRRARRLGRLPDPAALAEARRAVGYQNLELDPHRRTARLVAPHMRLDLGGIAKGYALDEALKVLRARGITRALVTGGGDMAAGQPPPDKPGWRIEIAPLDLPNAPPPRFVLLTNAGLATSGDAFQHVEIDGKRYSHIVNPRTGVGLTDRSLVTVIAADCTTADGLATAVSVLGPQEGLDLVERTRDAAAYIVRKPGEEAERFESRRFKCWDEPRPMAPRAISGEAGGLK